MNRTQKTMKNARFAVLCQIITLLVNLITRRLIVAYLATEYLGLGGLFSNILTVLSLAELGIGTSVTYSLYKPIKEGDEGKIRALMRLFGRAYTVIGAAVAALGAALLPLLRYFVDDIDAVTAAIPNFYVIYALYVANAASSYLFSSRRMLIVADQKRYLLSLMSALSQIILCGAAFAVFAITGNYVIFMAINIVVTFGENVILYIIAGKMYPYLKEKSADALTPGDKGEIKTNVCASAMHNIGGVLVNGTDNIIISRFVSFITEGIYTNYHMISAAVDSILRPIFIGATASFGDLSVDGDGERKNAVFHKMFFAGAWLYGFSAICVAVLSRPFVAIWLGEGFELDGFSVFFVALNLYLLGMRRACICARDAMGLMRYDKWKSIAEAAINLAASIILAKFMGLPGVLLGTTISCLSTCFWVEPLVLYKHGIGKGLGKYFARYALYAAVTGAAFAATYFICAAIPLTGIWGLIVKALVCLAVPNAIFAVSYCKIEEFKYFNNYIREKFKLSQGKGEQK